MNTNDMKLTEHFRLEEFTASATARRMGIDNTPLPYHITNLRNLCTEVLEPLRRAFGPITITSGYRCERLNEAVHGVGNSQHLYGEAADIRIKDIETGKQYFAFIRSRCHFDQLIFEHNRYGAVWIHVSCKYDIALNRHMALWTLSK